MPNVFFENRNVSRKKGPDSFVKRPDEVSSRPEVVQGSEVEEVDDKAALGKEYERVHEKAQTLKEKWAALQERMEEVGDLGTRIGKEFEAVDVKLAEVRGALAEGVSEKLEEFDKYIDALFRDRSLKRYTKDDPVFGKLFFENPNPKVVLKLIRCMRKSGSERYGIANRCLSYLKKYPNIDELISFLKLMKKRKISYYNVEKLLLYGRTSVKDIGEAEAFYQIFKGLKLKAHFFGSFFYLEGPRPSEVLLQIIPALQAMGVKNFDDIRYVYSVYKGDKGGLVEKVQRLLNAGITPDKIGMMLEGDDSSDEELDEKSEYVVALGKESIFPRDALRLYRADITLEQAKRMKPLLEFRTPLYDLIPLVKSPDFNQETMVSYFKILKKSKILGEYQFLRAWEVCKDSEKMVAYIKGVRSLRPRFFGSEIGLYKIEPSIEKVKEHYDKVIEWNKAGYNIMEAATIVFSSSLAKEMNTSFDELLKKFPEGTTKNAVFILMELVGGATFDEKVEKAIVLQESIKAKGADGVLFLNSTLDFVLPYIIRLKSAGIDGETIPNLYSLSRSSDEIIAALDFQKKYDFPIKRERAVVVTAAQSSSVELSGGILRAAVYCKDDPAKIAVLRTVFEQTSMIGYYNVEEFLKDPALDFCEEVFRRIGNADMALLIGRNLFLTGLEKKFIEAMTSEEIMQSYYRILELRKKYGEISLYEGREVVVLRHGEKWKPEYTDELGTHATPPELIGTDRFFDAETVEMMKTSMGPDADGRLDVIGPTSDVPTLEELRAVKERMLTAIVEKKPPATFLFDGHGSPTGSHFAEGEIVGGRPKPGEDVQFISEKEYADAIIKRIEKYGPEVTATDIYITTGCYGHTFGRNVSKRLAAAKLIAPITISGSEYGQYGFSEHTRSRGILVKVMGLGKTGVKLQHVIDHEQDYHSSNTSVYVPGPQTGTPVQIVATEKDLESDQRPV